MLEQSWSRTLAMADATTRLKLQVNGEPVETGAATLADLVAAQGFGGQKVATAINGEFVPARARADKQLATGDRIEIVSARAGG